MEGESGHDRVEGQGQGQVQGHQAGRSGSCSFSELFGDKDSRTNGVFESVFSPSSVPPPPSSSSSLSSPKWSSSSAKVNGSSVQEGPWRKDGDHQSDESTKNVSDIGIRKNSGEGLNTEQVEGVESFYLSSSLYYGGQDFCAPSPTSGSAKFPKEGNEDDAISNSSNSASRGNWWQGSLYY